MAERRMFAKTIIDSDAFLDMPLTAQALYFHLSMRADDDGFLNNPKKIQRVIGAADDDLKLLIAKNFIIPFESGVVVIKHWRIHNYIQKDRYKKTVYQEEKALLEQKENGAYTITKEVREHNVNAMYTECIQDADGMEAQVRLGKVRLGKVSKDNARATTKTDEVRHKHGEYQNVLLSDDELAKLKAEFPTDWSARIERLSSYIASTGKSYKNHLATIRNWARMEAERTGKKVAAKQPDFMQNDGLCDALDEIERLSSARRASDGQ